MRTLQTSGVVLAAALLVGCGAEAGEPAGREAPEEVGDGEGSPTVLDGTWVKTMTTKDAREMGIPARLARQIMGSDGASFSELRIDGASYAQYVDDGDAGRALGDGGSLSYGDEGTVKITSSSEGCPGCWATSRWTVDDAALTLEVLEFGNTDESPVELLVSRLMMEGTFVRQ